jgi:ankyrin repeat protein
MRLLILVGILSFASGILSTKIVNHKLDSILLQFTKDGNIEGVRELFAGHIIPDIEAESDSDWTALTTAANYGYIDIAKLLIDNGADVNAKINIGWTVLMIAVYNGHIDIAKMLIDNGANIDAKDDFRRTPLIHAVRYEYDNMIKLLIDNGADVNARDSHGKTARDYIKDKNDFDRIVEERKAKIRSLIQEQDQLIPDLGNIITDYI